MSVNIPKAGCFEPENTVGSKLYKHEKWGDVYAIEFGGKGPMLRDVPWCDRAFEEGRITLEVKGIGTTLVTIYSARGKDYVTQGGMVFLDAAGRIHGEDGSWFARQLVFERAEPVDESDLFTDDEPEDEPPVISLAEADIRKVIDNDSVDGIRKYLFTRFNEIDHVASSGMLLNRMERMEELLERSVVTTNELHKENDDLEHDVEELKSKSLAFNILDEVRIPLLKVNGTVIGIHVSFLGVAKFDVRYFDSVGYEDGSFYDWELEGTA